ncbi:MAG: hypothetical protein Q8922_07250 [Bacteroidota bacterium]|nr:hypothetical protein [Bacteroidota bacterium]MDP4233531.1 hypothetical protein [Bacteroidota bacterium]MDP4287717.1 hypothetical protein [Bacteroidota bacterium]
MSAAPTSEPIAVSEDCTSAESVLEEYVGRELHDDERHSDSSDHVPHGPLPIIFGVTGHRDLLPEDYTKIQDELRKQFVQISAHYPSTSFIMLSGLAEGADRVAAHLALELGLRLIAVLPMPRELYELDFKDESLLEFRELLDRAEHAFELPIMAPHTTSDISKRGPARDMQYAQLGAYLATHSQVLIALWDGVQRNLVGGTSQVVQFRLQGVPEPLAPPHSELDAPESGPVFHIVTPRRANQETVGRPFSVQRLYPPGFASLAEAEQAQRDIHERMEMFNKDAIRYAHELKEHTHQSKDYLFPSHLQHMLSPMLRQILDFYAIADVLSQRFQKRTLLAMQVMLGFFFMAAFFFELYAGPLPLEGVMVMYLVMFFLIFLVVKWASARGYQVKYLDYRALAEGLRVQFFWKLAGLKDSVADYYMRKQKSELDWIRNAVRSSMTETSAIAKLDDATPEVERERLSRVLQYWVEDQARYFAKAAHRNHDWHHKADRWITTLFGLGLALGVVQILIGEANVYLLLAVAMLPVGAAMLHSYLQRNAVSEHAKQYDRMSVFYHRAKTHLEDLLAAGAFERARIFIAELGREALTENGDWILTHRERPLEVPKGS